MIVYMFLQYSHVRQILTYLIFIFMRCIYIWLYMYNSYMQNNCTDLFCFVLLALSTNCWRRWRCIPSLLGKLFCSSVRQVPLRYCWTRPQHYVAHRKIHASGHFLTRMSGPEKSEKWYHGYIFKKGGPLLGSYRIIEIYNTCFVWFQVLFLTWNHRSILKSHLQCYLKRLVLWVDTFLHSASH